MKINMLTILLFIFLILVAVAVVYFFVAKAPEPKKITWGVNFSQMQSESLGLDWKKNYEALLRDLGTRHIKLHTQWNYIEGIKNDYYFSDTDWQVAKAQEYNADIIYVVGMKTGRWPECHLPAWALGLSKEEQQEQILEYIKEVVLRYKNSKAIFAWQAENEPLFKFGECPWYDKDFLKKEVALIKSLDPARPVIISDSGEQSFWFDAAKIGDIVGTTMYRKVWVHITDKYGFYYDFPIPPVSYWIKSKIVEKLFSKKVINVELQTEPWAPVLFKDVSLQEQEKSMDLVQFEKNIAYAKKSGFGTFYFWGPEWWYWLKETQNKPDIWNTAKELFK